MGSGSRWVLAHISELYSAEISEGVHHVTGRAFCLDYLDERHGLGAEEGAHAGCDEVLRSSGETGRYLRGRILKQNDPLRSTHDH